MSDKKSKITCSTTMRQDGGNTSFIKEAYFYFFHFPTFQKLYGRVHVGLMGRDEAIPESKVRKIVNMMVFVQLEHLTFFHYRFPLLSCVLLKREEGQIVFSVSDYLEVAANCRELRTGTSKVILILVLMPRWQVWRFSGQQGNTGLIPHPLHRSSRARKFSGFVVSDHM